MVRNDLFNVPQVDRPKTEDCKEKAYFEAMFGARIRYFRREGR